MPGVMIDKINGKNYQLELMYFTVLNKYMETKQNIYM